MKCFFETTILNVIYMIFSQAAIAYTVLMLNYAKASHECSVVRIPG